MLKVLGSACILGGGMLVRYLHALERRREMDTLSDLLSALRKMAEEIRMARTPLPAGEGFAGDLAAGCRSSAAVRRLWHSSGRTWESSVWRRREHL